MGAESVRRWVLHVRQADRQDRGGGGGVDASQRSYRITTQKRPSHPKRKQGASICFVQNQPCAKSAMICAESAYVQNLLCAESAACKHAAFSYRTATLKQKKSHYNCRAALSTQTYSNHCSERKHHLLEYHVTPSVRELVQQALPYSFSCRDESLLASPLQLSQRLPLQTKQGRRETNQGVAIIPTTAVVLLIGDIHI